jgi:hypothetical protein
MPLGQPPITDWWTVALKVAQWAARIPLAALAIFAAGCASYLGFYFILRLTQWTFANWLSQRW